MNKTPFPQARVSSSKQIQIRIRIRRKLLLLAFAFLWSISHSHKSELENSGSKSKYSEDNNKNLSTDKEMIRGFLPQQPLNNSLPQEKIIQILNDAILQEIRKSSNIYQISYENEGMNEKDVKNSSFNLYSQRKIQKDSSFPENIIDLVNETSDIPIFPGFEGLNALLYGVVLRIPDSTWDEDVSDLLLPVDIPLGKITLSLFEMKCYNLYVGNIETSHGFLNLNNMTFSFQVDAFNIDCDFGWGYRYGIIRESGKGSIQTRQSSASGSILIHSDDFENIPPNRTYFESCDGAFNVVNMDFNGGLTGLIADLLEGMFRDEIEIALRDEYCVVVEDFGNNGALSIIQAISKNFYDFYGEISNEDLDPLSGQISLLDLPMNFVSLSTNDSIAEFVMNNIFDLISELGDVIPDPNNPNNKKEDLRINNIMRNSVLNEDRVYSISPPDDPEDWFLFKTDNIITETEIWLKSVKVGGLDTMTHFNPLNILGSQTAQSSLGFEILDLLVEVEMTSRTSNHPDSIILESSYVEITEKISVYSSVPNINTTFSFLSAFDQNVLNEIHLGSILHVDQIFPCIISSYYIAELTELQFDSGFYRRPVITGLITEGIDKLLATTLDAFDSMYEGSIMKAMPNFFATTAKNGVNQIVTDLITSNTAICPKYDKDATGNKFINLQDLLLIDDDPQGSEATFPYGELPSMLKKTVDDFLLKEDNINEFIIKPFTLSQSNIEGVFLRKENAFKFTTDSIDLKGFDFKLENLDSFDGLTRILDPRGNNPNLLHSQVEFGPIHASTGLSLTIVDDKLYENDLKVNLELARTDVLLSLLLKIEEDAFLSMPLGSVANLDCWFATLPYPELNVDGFLSEDFAPSLSVHSLSVSDLANIKLDIECISCSSSGIGEIPKLMNILRSAGIIEDILSGLMSFVEEILEGDYTDTYIARFIEEANKNCPNSPHYIERIGDDRVVSDYEEVPPPALSRESLEFLILSAFVVVESIGALYALHIDLTSTEYIQDPAMGDILLESMSVNRTDVFDLSSTQDLIGGRLKKFLEEEVEVSLQDGEGLEKILGINNLMRTIFLDSNGRFSVDIGENTFRLFGFDFSFVNLQILGLDSFKFIDVYNIFSEHTLHNHFVLEYVRIQLSLKVKEPFKDEEIITFSFGLSDIDFSLALLLAFSKSELGNLQLGPILDTTTIVSCILLKAHAIEVTQLELSIGTFEEIDIVGFISEDTRKVIRSATRLIYDKYGRAIRDSLQNVMREELEKLKTKFLLEQVCELKSGIKNLEFLDFRDLFLDSDTAKAVGASGTIPYGNVPSIVMNLIKNEYLSPNEEGLALINEELINPLTKSQSNFEGLILMHGDVFNVGNLNEISLQISDVRIANINSIGFPLQFFNPSENQPQTLINQLSLAKIEEPLQLETTLRFNLGEGVKNELSLRLEVQDMSILLSTMAMVSEASFLEFPLRHIFDPFCWISIIPAPRLNEFGARPVSVDPTFSINAFNMSYSYLNLTIECVLCTNPQLNLLSTTFQSIFDDPESISGSIENFMRSSLLQDRIDRYQYSALKKCPFNSGYFASESIETIGNEFIPVSTQTFTDDSLRNIVNYVLLGSFIILISIARVLLPKLRFRSHHRKMIRTAKKDELIYLFKKQEQRKKDQKNICSRTKSMVLSPAIPITFRLAMPIITLGNIALFLSGHLSLGGALDVVGQVIGEEISLKQFVRFSIFQSIIDSWIAGARSLSAVLAIFSGIWPYTKQLVTLSLWFASPTIVTTRTRGTILNLLDEWGKWSMIDIYILILTMIAFRISVRSPSLLPADFYEIDILVLPLWGLYANMMAQVISQLNSHAIIYYHKKILSEAKHAIKQEKSLDVVEGNMEETGNIDNVCSHIFLLDNSQNTKMKTRPWVNVLVASLGFISISLLLLGSIFPTIRLEIFGVVGLVLEAGNHNQEAVRELNIFNIVEVIIDEALFVDSPFQYIGMFFLSILLIATSVIIPICVTLVLQLIWFKKMERKARDKLIFIFETLKAWQYVEVYIISVIFAAGQLGGVSQFLLNEQYCSQFGDQFSLLTYYGLVGVDDAQCFYNQATILVGMIYLILGSFTLSVLSSIVISATKQKHKEDEALSNDEIEIPLSFDLQIKIPEMQFTDYFKILMRPLPQQKSDGSSPGQNSDTASTFS